MGGNCCKESNEDSKPPIFEPNPPPEILDENPQSIQRKPQTTNLQPNLNPNNNNNNHDDENPNNPDPNGSNPALNEEMRLQQKKQEQAEDERRRILREEKMRLDSIIADAGRDMVGLGSVNIGDVMGNMSYYDPGHAASIEQDFLSNDFALDLEAAYKDMYGTNNVSVDEHLATLVSGRNKIPPTTIENGMAAVEELTRRVDFSDRLRKTHVRYDEGGTGGNKMESLEDAAERFLASVIPTKEVLFQDVGPIVESLP